MKIIKVLSILALVFLAGCDEDRFNKEDCLLVQLDKNQAPFSGKVTKKNENSYTINVFSTGKEIEVPMGSVLGQMKSAVDESLAIYDWKQKNVPMEEKYSPKEIVSMKQDLKTKQQMMFLGLIPLVLLIISAAFKPTLIVAIPYIAIVAIPNPALFLSIFLVFGLLSCVLLFVCIWMTGGFNAIGGFFGSVAWVVFMILFFMH